MSLFQGPIKSRVMKSINERIDKAEEAYVADCELIDQEAEEKKTKAADKHVEAILGKIL